MPLNPDERHIMRALFEPRGLVPWTPRNEGIVNGLAFKGLVTLSVGRGVRRAHLTEKGEKELEVKP